MSRKLTGLLAATLLAIASMFSSTASAVPYSDVFVFGDSISDSGNNAILSDVLAGGERTSTPLSGPVVPIFPYVSDRYSNGPVWVEYLAANLGLSAQPALAGGTNFAFGGARTGAAGSDFPLTSLKDQVRGFLLTTRGDAPSDALYVVEGGGNDARDIFSAVLGGAAPSALIGRYVNNVLSVVQRLAKAGADQFLLWDVPDIGKLPAITTLGSDVSTAASALAALMNQTLLQALGGLSPEIADGIHLFDAYGALDSIVADPAAFGLRNATDACAIDVACIADPDGHFFWDGIHPTTAGHAVIAQFAQLALGGDPASLDPVSLNPLASVAEPETLLLLVVGLFSLGATRRRKH